MCAPYYAVSLLPTPPSGSDPDGGLCCSGSRIRDKARSGGQLHHPGRSPEEETKERQQDQDDKTSHAAALLYPWKREFAPYRARGDNRVAAFPIPWNPAETQAPPSCGRRGKRLEKGIGKRLCRPLPDRYGACAPPTTRSVYVTMPPSGWFPDGGLCCLGSRIRDKARGGQLHHPGRSPEEETKERQQDQDDKTSHAAALLYPWKREFAPYRARGDNRVAAFPIPWNPAETQARPCPHSLSIPSHPPYASSNREGRATPGGAKKICQR